MIQRASDRFDRALPTAQAVRAQTVDANPDGRRRGGHRLGQRRPLAPYYLENQGDVDALLAESRDQSQTA